MKSSGSLQAAGCCAAVSLCLAACASSIARAQGPCPTGTPGYANYTTYTQMENTLLAAGAVHSTEHGNEITLVGSRCGRMEAALPWIANPAIRLEEMLSDRFALSDAPRAFTRAAERGVLKVLLA